MWGTATIKKLHCCCPSCKVVNPWQKTQPNPRAWKSKDGVTLSLHWNQAYHIKNSPSSCCSCRRCFVPGLFFPRTACVKSLSLDQQMPWSSLWNRKVKIHFSVTTEFQKYQILQQHKGCRIHETSTAWRTCSYNNYVFVWLPAWTPALTSNELLRIFLESIFNPT